MVSASVWSSFRSPQLVNLASKGFLPWSWAVMVQYSLGTNSLISSSRSQMIRVATDWTRPADRPLRTLAQRMGLIL